MILFFLHLKEKACNFLFLKYKITDTSFTTISLASIRIILYSISKDQVNFSKQLCKIYPTRITFPFLTLTLPLPVFKRLPPLPLSQGPQCAGFVFTYLFLADFFSPSFDYKGIALVKSSQMCDCRVNSDLHELPAAGMTNI